MKLSWDSRCDEVDIAGTAEELTALAAVVTAGEGHLAVEDGELAGIETVGTDGPGVMIRVDAARRVLAISGDADGREVLAEGLRDMASADDGGHWHIDHYPGHAWLAEGSVALVVNSPLGGMPLRGKRS
ncbi:Imm32 family immunity protein [Kitasatospora griseola]|uniref:Imm32 family immunity protein n=1 Tax=Kitasatospora griseola TaxID=2064 RepID=UPI00382112E3